MSGGLYAPLSLFAAPEGMHIGAIESRDLGWTRFLSKQYMGYGACRTRKGLRSCGNLAFE